MNPYFYIIRNKNSGLKYAGCKYSKDSDPSNLLTTSGYLTSSKVIHRIIASEGIDSFEILEIKTDIEDVFKYETDFLVYNNCAQS